VKGETAMSCEFKETCWFFADNAAGSKAVQMLKEVYCLNNYQACARYMLMTTLGPEHLPPSLYPNQTHLVPSITRKASGV